MTLCEGQRGRYVGGWELEEEVLDTMSTRDRESCIVSGVFADFNGDGVLADRATPVEMRMVVKRSDGHHLYL